MNKYFWIGSGAQRGYPYYVIRVAVPHRRKDGVVVARPTGETLGWYRSSAMRGGQKGITDVNTHRHQLRKNGWIEIEKAWQKIKGNNDEKN